MAFGDLLQIVEDNDKTDPNTVAYTSNVRAGSLLIAHHSGENGVTITVTDTQGNVWADAATEDVPSFLARLTIKYTIARMSGPNTLTFSGGASGIIYAIEYDGSFDSSPLDPGTGVGDFGITDAVSSGNLTTSRDGCMLLGFMFAGADLTVGGGWTADDDSAFPEGFAIASRFILTTAGTDAAEATGGAGGWICVAAAFRPGISKNVQHLTLTGVGT